MFLIVGLDSKIKDCGRVRGAICPVCGREGTLHLCHQYMTPTVFFIPTFRLKSSYIATCAGCASVMELGRQKGRAVERGEDPPVSPGELRVLRDNAAPLCPHCGARLHPGGAFCSRCGGKL